MGSLNNFTTKLYRTLSTAIPHFRVICARKMMDMHISSGCNEHIHYKSNSNCNGDYVLGENISSAL